MSFRDTSEAVGLPGSKFLRVDPHVRSGAAIDLDHQTGDRAGGDGANHRFANCACDRIHHAQDLYRVVAASPPDDETPTTGAAEQIRLLRLGMQGLIDQMQAGVARLVDMDITLRDISSGLIDFPALVTGRPIWLCYRLGETAVESWHPHDEGFDSRRPLAELPTSLGRGSGTPAA